jgi:hypothetical protein
MAIHLHRLARRVARESLRRRANAALSPNAQKIVRTLASGKKGAIDMTAFPEVLEALGGSALPTTSAQKLDPERLVAFLPKALGIKTAGESFLTGDWAQVDRRHVVLRVRSHEQEQLAEKIRAAGAPQS